MPFDLGGIVGSAITGLLGSGADYLFGKEASKESFENSIKAYQNRYQWTMADMRKAGLNPILAALPGGLSGSFPQMQSWDTTGVFSNATEFQESRRTEAEVREVEQKILNWDASTGKLKQEEQVAIKEIQATYEKMLMYRAQAAESNRAADKYAAEYKILMSQAAKYQAMQEAWSTEFAKFMAYVAVATEALGPAGGGMGAAAILKLIPK